MYNAIERVEAGVKFLDKNYSAWAEEAATDGQTEWLEAFRYYDYHDIDKFNIDNSYTCILGRLIKYAGFETENYFNMRANLGINYDDCKRLGFTTSLFEDDPCHSVSEETRELNEAWIVKLDELLDRKKEDTVMKNEETIKEINEKIDKGINFLNTSVNQWLKEHTDKTKWLDAFKNFDYYDINHFNINDSMICILARIMRWSFNNNHTFFNALDLLKIDYHYTEKIGMAIPSNLAGVNSTLYAEMLTQEWVKRLNELTA